MHTMNKNNNNGNGLGKPAAEFKNRKEEKFLGSSKNRLRGRKFFFYRERQSATEDSIRYNLVINKKRKAQPTSNSLKVKDEMDKRNKLKNDNKKLELETRLKVIRKKLNGHEELKKRTNK